MSTATFTFLWQTDWSVWFLMPLGDVFLFSWCSWNPGPRPPAAEQAGAVVQCEWPQWHLRRGKPPAGLHPAPQQIPGRRNAALLHPSQRFLKLVRQSQGLNSIYSFTMKAMKVHTLKNLSGFLSKRKPVHSISTDTSQKPALWSLTCQHCPCLKKAWKMVSRQSFSMAIN